MNVDFTSSLKNLLNALIYLHTDLQFAHGLITPESIVWSNGIAKFANWPLNLITAGGHALNSHVILPKVISYVAPENVKKPKMQATFKSDIWSTSLSLLKLIKPSCKIPENPARLALCDNSIQIIELIDGHLDDSIIECSSKWNEYFLLTLNPDPNTRANLFTIAKLFGMDKPELNKNELEQPLDRDEYLKLHEQAINLDISELYHLWRLSTGRNFESEQKQDDCPPIFRIPYLIVSESQSNAISECKLKPRFIINTTPKPIPLDQFKKDLGRLDEKIFNPLILTKEEIMQTSTPNYILIDLRACFVCLVCDI